jgi:predicted RNA-binding protein with RPS1 domain
LIFTASTLGSEGTSLKTFLSEVLNSMINDMIASKLSVTDMASYGYISDYMSSIDDDYASSVYDGIFDSISDLGSIDDEIDIKVFKTNKDGETTVTEQQPADKKTKPKATKEAAKKPAAAKPSEEERFES